LVIFNARQSLVGQDLLTVEVSRSHSDTPQTVGLLWMSDQPDAEISLPVNTHSSQQADIHSPGGIRTPNPSKRAAAEPLVTPRGHRDRLLCAIYELNVYVCMYV
jgi:hypothetical protein